jgi:hypothetical protein
MAETVNSSVDQIPEVIKRLAAKAPITSPLRSAELRKLPQGLLERAQFSAGVEDAHVVQGLTDKLDEWAAFAERDPERAFMDRTKFVVEMKSLLGSPDAEDSGSLTDIASRRRLELIYNFQTTDAAEYARHVVGQDPAILDAFPCQELIRLEDRKVPRNWIERWTGAGGKLFGSRMIATKDDPIWTAISAFGRPWPPFDFGSGMGLQDISRTEAEQLGVITAKTRVKPTLDSFNQGLQASVTDLDPQVQHRLKAAFGSQITIKNGVASWKANS